MLGGLLIILTCQLLGEFVTRSTGLPVPGPVLGMLLFWGWLTWRRPAQDGGEVKAAQALLSHLPLFFVPAGVGIVVYTRELARQAGPVTAGLLVSWLVALLVTAGVAALVARTSRRRS